MVLVASTGVEAPAPASGGWSTKEIAGLVVTGVLILVLWLLFRRLKLQG